MGNERALITKKDQGEGLVGKGAWCQAEQLEFESQDPSGGRREMVPMSCSLIFTHKHINANGKTKKITGHAFRPKAQEALAEAGQFI